MCYFWGQAKIILDRFTPILHPYWLICHDLALVVGLVYNTNSTHPTLNTCFLWSKSMLFLATFSLLLNLPCPHIRPCQKLLVNLLRSQQLHQLYSIHFLQHPSCKPQHGLHHVLILSVHLCDLNIFKNEDCLNKTKQNPCCLQLKCSEFSTITVYQINIYSVLT